MDDKRKKEETRKSLQKKFRTKELPCKYKVKHPINAERKYQKLIQKLMRTVKQGIVESWNPLQEFMERAEKKMGDDGLSERQRKKKRRHERINSLQDDIEELELLFWHMERAIALYEAKINVPDEIKKISRRIESLNEMEWKRAVQETVGLDPPPKSYYSQMHREAMRKWEKDNVEWASAIIKDSIMETKSIIYSAYIDGKTSNEIYGEIKKGHSSSLRRNKALVINRVANINTEITKQKHLDAGIKEYIWQTRRDERVRESHRRLHGKKFSWDSPPETDGGRHCHPGEDYGCRCIALPSFNLETIEL